ncbi:hypothetical protein PR048_033459 [Dryococelus australis]|uniref:Ras association domain-containing protein 10 n=1 Tax=Dryococelus australis TaxID=614101 RepID=A0ABQ9G4H4_9NEOP|nr:hypothetical protein PR048_033459 [Dryococelus australis]
MDHIRSATPVADDQPMMNVVEHSKHSQCGVDQQKSGGASMTTNIPVWVNSRQRWVTGVGRKTTCDDVIAVLTGGGGDDAKSEAGCYAIMERWRRVERPLDGRSRILRVWEAWGDERGEVRLTLKRVDWEADSGRGSPVASARRRKHRSGKLPWPARHETLHPRRLAQLHRERSSDLHHASSASSKLPETIERLMRLILAQGETIQSQLRRIQDREQQIETLEGETHRARVEKLGSNYLLETYLGASPDDKADDSGVTTDRTPLTSSPSDQKRSGEEDDGNDADDSEDDTKDSGQCLEELQARVELLEKLVKVNKRLEREEECLVRLHIKLKRQQSRAGLRVLPDEEWDEDSYRMRNDLLGELERARREYERRGADLENTALALAETDSLLEARRHYMRRLQAELEASDRESDRLSAEAVTRTEDRAGSSPASQTDTDSTSDTGLSSLHSSSEEGVYVLDTLV